MSEPTAASAVTTAVTTAELRELLETGNYDAVKLLLKPVQEVDIAEAIGDWATVHEFTEIGHADLLECPDEATELVTSFFKQHADA